MRRLCSLHTDQTHAPRHACALQPDKKPGDLPTQLTNLLSQRKALIIVDDIWRADDVFGNNGLLEGVLGKGLRVVLTGACMLFL